MLAFRLAAQDLAVPAASLVEAARSWTIGDSPPGAAALALSARVRGLTPDALETALLADRTLVALYNPRTAVSVIPREDVAAFGAALLPRDPALLERLVGPAVPGGAVPAPEAVDLTVAAVGDALAAGPLSRDDLHQALRERLPAELLPWCEGCQSHHARRWLLVAACLRGELCLAGRAGRQVAFARPDLWLGAPLPVADPEAAARGLVLRFARAYGPATPALLAEWAGIARERADAGWTLAVDALTAVDGGGSVPVADAALLAAPPPLAGLRLLPPGDPLLLARDRERLAPDPALRQRIWRATGSPGVVLGPHGLAGLWRPRKQGRRLTVTVEPTAGPLDRDALQREADRIAPFRGAASAEVVLA